MERDKRVGEQRKLKSTVYCGEIAHFSKQEQKEKSIGGIDVEL